MFRTFIKEQLENNNETQFLLIGEDHQHGSALIGLAHCIDEMKLSNKKVIVVTENLKRLQGFFHGEKAYTSDTVKKNLKATDQDTDALLTLIKNNVTVYGMETEKTAPGLFLLGKTKASLYDELAKKIPTLVQHDNTNKKLIEAKNDSSVDVSEFIGLINFFYGESRQRITVTNNEIVSQLRLLAIENPENTLIIFAGGAAHLPEAMELHDENKIVHPGVFALLNKTSNGLKVNCAVFTSSHMDVNNPHYRPKADTGFQYGVIPNRKIVPEHFTVDGSDLDKVTKRADAKSKDHFQVFSAKPQETAPVGDTQRLEKKV